MNPHGVCCIDSGPIPSARVRQRINIMCTGLAQVKLNNSIMDCLLNPVVQEIEKSLN